MNAKQFGRFAKDDDNDNNNDHFEYACKLSEVAQAFWNLNLVAHQYDVEFSFINVLLESALSRSRRCDF